MFSTKFKQLFEETAGGADKDVAPIEDIKKNLSKMESSDLNPANLADFNKILEDSAKEDNIPGSPFFFSSSLF